MFKNLLELETMGRLEKGDELVYKIGKRKFKYRVVGAYLEETGNGDNLLIFRALNLVEKAHQICSDAYGYPVRSGGFPECRDVPGNHVHEQIVH